MNIYNNLNSIRNLSHTMKTNLSAVLSEDRGQQNEEIKKLILQLQDLEKKKIDMESLL